MNFISPSTSVTAAHWNDIFQSADAQLGTTLGGLSAVLCGVDKQWDRGFFFFDPLNVSQTALHPQAASFLLGTGTNVRQYWTNILQQPALYLRQYNHGAITTLVNSLSVSTTSTKFGVAKLAKPTWAAWSAAIYPSGFGTVGTSGLDSMPDNILDVSLGVIKVTVSGTPYNVTFNDVTTAEHAQPLKPIDVFITGNVTWDNTSWNKYSLVRVHNCGRNPATIFGTSIKSGASRCFRNLAGTWAAQGNYFHWMHSGDGRFLQLTEAPLTNPLGTAPGTAITVPGGASSIGQPAIVLDVLATALSLSASNFGAYFDPAKFWDLSGIYNNPAYAPTPTEKTPPTGGYLPALSSSVPLGDLIVHRGQVMAFQNNTTYPLFNFIGFANLASTLTAAGINHRALTQTNPWNSAATVTNLEIYSPGQLVDLSSPLVTFITGGAPAKVLGASQATTPPSLRLPMLLFGAMDVEPSPSTASYNYYTWSWSGSGTPQLNSLQTVTINLAGSTATPKQTVFLPTDSATTAQSRITSTTNAGGIVTATNFKLLSTAFGPVQLWDELWPLDARFTEISSNGRAINFIARVVLDQSSGNKLRVTRAVFLNDTWSPDGVNIGNAAVWPPRGPAASTVAWNFPRQDQQYRFARWFQHNPADTPLMPNWSTYFSGSNYADTKYVNNLIGGSGGNPPWWNDALSQFQFNVVTSFYESTPISTDAVR